MKKKDYLNDKSVIDFIYWIEPLLIDSFSHSYNFKKGQSKNWSCNSIFDAYEKYRWGNGINTTFDDSQKELISIKKQLKKALDDDNHANVKKACINMLKWGGLKRKNEKYIINNPDIIKDLKYIKNKIDPCMYDTNNQSLIEILITSGFSKIYSVLLDDFVIYDSRVSTALCYFIRTFCDEKNIEQIPENLVFAFSKAHNPKAKRNPNNKNYVFPNINQNNY